MAVTVLPGSSLTESVKQALRSTTTCSDATVLSLQTLLRAPPKMAEKSTKRTKSIREPAAAPPMRTRTSRATKTKSTSEAALQTLADHDAAALSCQEKLVFATEVFNATLKTLTDAAKTSAAKRQNNSSENASGLDAGITSAAECARFSLSTLRALKNDAGNDQFPNMQLEQGLCVLAGKLISLGLNDIAYKELRLLKRRIQQYLDRGKTGKKSPESKESTDEEVAKERMSDLLTFAHISNAKPLFGLLVPFHSNVMRLFAADRRASTIQKVCSSLQLSDPSSPAQVILAALKSGQLSNDKAALQLQLLSNTILSLCSGTSFSKDEASNSLKPITSLTLQLLSLEVRCLSWKLSGHVCDEGKEVFDPLLRYFVNFSHRSKGIEKVEFASIYKTVTRLQTSVSEIKKSSEPLNATQPAKLVTILGQLAFDAGCFDESMKLFNQAINPLSKTQSLSLATVRCKIASVHFQALKTSKKFLKGSLSSLSEATDSLGLQLRGSANDLDELLVEAARLKKVALAWFGEAITQSFETEGEKNQVAGQIREYLQAFLRFLRRYVGRQPTEDSDEREVEIFNKRIEISRSIILAAIDSTVAIGKLSIMSQRPPWEDMLPILSDCHRLLSTIENPDGQSTETTENLGMALVKLSNLFWSRYIKAKEAGQGSRELIPLLKQSTQLLSSCSPSQRNTAFAALKFERMAHLYLDGHMYSESEKMFRQSIEEYILSGTLEQIVKSSGAQNPSMVNQDPKSPGFMLGRVLSALLKMKLRRKGSHSSAVYDDSELNFEQRGLLLEWQMNLLVDMHSYALNEEEFRSMLGSAVSSLLDLYPLDTYPIRHSRVILSALRLLLEHPTALDSSMIETLLNTGKEALDAGVQVRDDIELASFAIHICNSLRIIIGFHRGKIDPSELDDTLASWTSLARQCREWKTMLLCISDTDYWVLQLKALVDYTEIHGLWKAQLCTLELILRAAELQQSGDLSDAIIILSRLVLQNCRLGYCQKAAELLSRGEQYLAQTKVSSLATISYQVSRVEYLLETGEPDKAADVLSTAHALYEKCQKSELSNLSVLSKISWERLVADAAFVQSRLFSAQGSATQALYFAKLSVRLNCRIWAKVERLAQRKQDKLLPAAASSEVEAVADGIAKLDLSQKGSSPDVSASYIQGAPFWPHLGSHHTCLLNLATLSAHHGLFQDAIYYAEQALKIDKTLDANARLLAAQTQLGCHWIISGHLDEGQDQLSAAAESSKQTQRSIETVSFQMALASLYKIQGAHDKALRVLLEADKIITALASADTPANFEASGVAEIEEKMDKLRVRASSRRTPTPTTTTTTRRTRSTSSAVAKTTKKAPAPKPTLPEVESKSLLQLKGNILRQQADCLRELRDFERSAQTLAEARQFAVARESKITLEIGESEHLLADAIRRFASHAVYCVLPESTISLPSLKTPSKTAIEPSIPAKPSTRRTRAAPKTSRTKAQKASEDFSVMLSKASDCLASVFSDATILGSTLDSHAASRLMSRISMLSHATSPGIPATLAQSPANMNEIGRVGAFARERMAIDIDRQLADFADPLLWPTSFPSAVELDDDLCSNFTQDYVDILPESWNVLSLSLSADQTEFVVSRLQKDRSPFLLRLPLHRGNSEDDDEEQFTFEDGKGEMQELIKLANESAHAAKLQTDKLSKKEWWKTREALDRRMESVLQNIENIWFGGFRGVFSPLSRETTALARFASTFQNILDKHLPSRQKGGKAAGPRLTLHQNVVDLFVGLRDLEEQEEPEDTLMDLLYFVVDILQFQGERNAYDEIDFDMMVVDTLDALRCYHEAARDELAARPPKHTILVLDKALHLFPWESLPCLQGYPVCRVPSLECLRDRVLQFRESSSGAIVDRKSGAYVLNPTGDLLTTQTTFEQDLSRFKSWTAVVQREPTEDEFRDCLEKKGLFLYFGHGSGAQYIRGRTVKRLTQCAVTFLMGCSSGTLTEAGEYEPYGTPLNYLHAGSPALVATLWDVTDRDIDRFTTTAFDAWGLVEKKDKKDKDREDVGLDAAVARSRTACVLKYLNGAAPVVYGVPVFLE
ncbi:Peptidase C50 separase [Penicillium paradoxum]|uniref:Peptidase C50 separase n=1 Tax=Penicillium paradoxum TaxID=176176 RepID=UPI002548E4C0|nr:Peptidase C50 separase [Penicillium paradoxum]KAJ5794530.1 Peptidase C50 separase [Penicillium paradoxum]